jgi:RNA-directed DNA polymerase
MKPPSQNFFLRNLCDGLLAGNWTHEELANRAEAAWGRRWRKLRKIIRECRKHFHTKPRFDELLDWLASQKTLTDSLPIFGTFKRRRVLIYPPTLELPAVPVTGPMPPIRTLHGLATSLGLSQGQLTVYADLKNLPMWGGPKKHPYRYRVVRKRGTAGADKFRVLEIPKQRLMRAQRYILEDILNLLPAHDAVHSFRADRSILTNAQIHAGKLMVVKFDLKDFFPSIRPTRVRGIFAKLGFPQEISRHLTALCTTNMPHGLDVPEKLTIPELQPYRRRHLPQGAPTSPAISNLATYRLDCRLTGLGKRFDAVYTRYADDLTFSGGFELRRTVNRLRKWVIRIVIEEGFEINAAKTQVKSASDRQAVTGLIVNEKPNIRRRDFDTLKAILTNCLRHGPASQNRENHPHFRAHLRGRIAFVASINPARGAKLLAIYDRIAWPA